MIKKIILRNFGKFKDQVFDMKPVTVFVGPNEAGKTTVFDALFDQLCSPGANLKDGKRLKERYGDKREAQLEFDAARWEFEVAEFTNIFAIRAGVSDIEFEKNSKWTEAVKNAIFSGGIDPEKLSRDLEKLGRDSGTLVHVKERKAAEKKLEEEKERFQRLQAERQNLLGQETAVKDGVEKLKQIDAQISEKHANLANLRQQLEIQEKIRERQRIETTLAQLQRQKELSEKVSSLAVYSNDETIAARDLEQKISGFAHKLAEVRGEITALEQQMAQLEDEIRKIETHTDKQQPNIELARALRIELSAGRAREREVVKTVLNKPLIAIAATSAICSVAGFAGFIKVESWAPQWMAGVALLVMAGVLFAVGYRRKTIVILDTESDQRLLGVLKDKWRNATTQSLQSATVDGALEELSRIVSGQEQALQRLAEHKDLRRQVEASVADKRKKSGEHGNELGSSEKALDDWLRAHKVTDLAEYQQKRAAYNATQAALAQISDSLAQQMAEAGNDAETLSATLLAKLAILQKEITLEEYPEAQRQRLRNQVDALESELSRLSAEKTRQSEIVHHGAGGFEARMGNLPRELRSCQQEIDGLETEIKDYFIEMQAARYASDLFKSISNDQSHIFESLSEEISAHYSQMFPEGREVTISSFAADSIEIADIGGKKRSVEHVSTATKDAFYLSARLAFARKTRGPEPGIIVLDEPFASYDRDRRDHAIGFLRKFHEQHGWQVVVFTKDEGIAEAASELLSNDGAFLVHRLSA